MDSLHTDDIKQYVKTHFGPVDRVEWIDDTSANLLFANEPTARDAFAALSAIEVADVTALSLGESLPAKPFESKPEVSLQIRFAVQSDRKQAGAALRSRYYLLHPEHDPEERRRRHQENRARYRDRDGERRRRNSDDKVETYEASMYDDAPRPRRSHSRHGTDSDDQQKSYVEENRGKELFAYRASRRDRSASPRRDGENDARMDEVDRSSHQNRAEARSIRNRLNANNSSKELFPTKSSDRGGQLDQLEDSIGSARLREEDMPKMAAVAEVKPGGAFNIRGLAKQKGSDDSGFAIKGAASANARELFPDKLGPNNAGKELIGSASSKQRQKAQDLFS